MRVQSQEDPTQYFNVLKGKYILQYLCKYLSSFPFQTEVIFNVDFTAKFQSNKYYRFDKLKTD